MNELLEKIGTYNIFNYLLPGVVFSVFVSKLTPYELVQDDILAGAFVYYFVGSVISRIGSLLVEPILKWTGFVSFSTYDDFVCASKNDDKIEVLSEANNMYRTICSLFLCIAVAYIYGIAADRIYILREVLPGICVVGLFVLFAFSFRKQTIYINKRISAVKSGVSK